MFSLFISFDVLISFINQFCFFFFLILIFFFSGYNFFFFVSFLISFILNFLNKEILITTKLKSFFSVSFFFSIFFLLVFVNLMGMTPFYFTLSTQLNFCFFFSFLFWLSIMMNNFFNNYAFFIPHLVPSGSPLILSQFMVLIESISQLIRPLTLGVRLMANMTAGHLIMILCSSSIFLLGFFTMPFLLLLVLEFMVAFIQSYVFVILLSMYLGEFNN